MMVSGKSQIDKSKLSANFYSSFDSFVNANTVMEETQANLKEKTAKLE